MSVTTKFDTLLQHCLNLVVVLIELIVLLEYTGSNYITKLIDDWVLKKIS